MPPEPFMLKQMPPILEVMDPDDVLKFFWEVTDYARENETVLQKSIVELTDANTCPAEYLKYLARMLNLQLDSTDPEAIQRRAISAAASWYKEKGKLSAFELFFRSIGYTSIIHPLWSDKHGNIERYQVDETWVPHARVDVELFDITTSGLGLLTGDLAEQVLGRIDEVRPVHVLLRGFFTGFSLADSYPTHDIEDTIEEVNLLVGQFGAGWTDTFQMLGRDIEVVVPEEVLYHYTGHMPAVLRNGTYHYSSSLGGPIIDPETGTDLTRSSTGERGIPVLRNNGNPAFHDGNFSLGREGGELDDFPFLYDGRPHEALYFYDNQTAEYQGFSEEDRFEEFTWSVANNFEDEIPQGLVFRDGSTSYDAEYTHDGFGAPWVDRLDLEISFFGETELELQEEYPSDELLEENTLEIASAELISDDYLQYNGELQTRDGASIYLHNFGTGVTRNGALTYDGASEHDAEGHLLRDGTITYSGGAYEALARRDNNNPFGSGDGEVFEISREAALEEQWRVDLTASLGPGAGPGGLAWPAHWAAGLAEGVATWDSGEGWDDDVNWNDQNAPAIGSLQIEIYDEPGHTLNDTLNY